MSLLIIKNITREGPGLLEEILKEKSIEYKIVDLDNGEEFPSTKEFKAVVVLGGPDSANHQTAKIKNELERIEEVLADQKPYLGICLGLQTLVKAAGGQVIKSPTKEIGFIDPENNNFKVELTENGKNDALFENLENEFKVFHLHGETVELTNQMTLLATGQFCKIQIARVGSNAYGIQCHFELTPEMFETWITEDPDLTALDTEQLRKEFKKIKDHYTKVGKQLFKNFLNIAGY